MKQIIEISAIFVVSVLLIIFASLYFVVTKRQKKLNAATKNNISSESDADITNITAEWAEQLQIIQAQLDLMGELSAVFTVCYDYGRNCFSLSENGQIQLGFKSGQDDILYISNIPDISDMEQCVDQKKFEDLIHPDDIFIYEEITGAENIRKSALAESPYVLRLKQADSQNLHKYGEYLTRIKPVYDENGISVALIIAFINTEYLKSKR